MTTTDSEQNGERGDLLEMLAELRHNLLITVRGISDEQARQRTTVSELTLGGIVKHIGRGFRVWAQIMVRGDGEVPDGMLDLTQYQMTEDDTLADLLHDFEAGARAFDDAVAGVPDLDQMVLLPVTPWSPPEPVYWSARRIVLHLMRETAQHAGHADVIRETLDGASTTAQLGS
jgi:uncharacterized damage-inducible protein DinB